MLYSVKRHWNEHGVRFVVKNDLPRPLIGHWIHPLHAHPLWVWWERVVWRSRKGSFLQWLRWSMYGEPEMLRVGNTIYLSENQYRAIRESGLIARVEGPSAYVPPQTL